MGTAERLGFAAGTTIAVVHADDIDAALAAGIDVTHGSTTFFAAQELDASDPEAVSWQVNVVVDLGGSFGTADSASTFVATLLD